MRERWFHIPPLVLWAMFVAEAAAAQEVAAPTPEGGVSTTQPRRGIEESLPPIHLRNKDGELVPVPGLSLEEFQKLLEARLAEDGALRPRYIIQSVDATGEARQSHVEFTFDFQILVNAAGWSRIPLRLPEGIIEEEAEYDGPGAHFLDLDPDAGGYVSWIRSEAGEVHRLTLRLLAPLVTRATESRFKLTAPRSTKSVLKLEIPSPNQVGKVLGGATLDEPRPSASPGSTEVTLRRLEGEFELLWRPANSIEATATTQLEAVSSIAARIDGRSIRYVVQMSVRSLAGDFSGFQVQLPESARLVQGEQPGYKLVEAEGESAAGRWVQVTLDKPSSGSVECRIIAERPYNPTRLDEHLELAGFEVLEAVRQWGHIGVYVVGDWQAVWGSLDNGVRRVENLPESLRRDELAAGYEFARQPFSLPVRIIPRETRTHVDPEYLFLISGRQVQLQARWKFRVRGAKAFTVEVDMPGWEIEELGPDNLVNLDAASTKNRSPLSIPLLQPAAGTFEIFVRASRLLAEDASTLELSLPVPRANTVSPAAVVLLPDDNVELRLRSDRTTGLFRQRVAPPMALPARQQEPLFFRGEVSQARFAADLNQRSQAISMMVHSRLELGAKNGRVRQRFACQIAHEPLAAIFLTAPKNLLEERDLTFEVEGERLTASVIAAADASSDEATIQLSFPAPRIGAVDISADFALEPSELLPGASTLRRVPLIVPKDVRLERHELEVRSVAGLRVALRDDRWTTVAASAVDQAGPTDLRLETHELTNEIALALHLEDPASQGRLVVEKAWIQSWLATDGRTDRALYYFAGNSRRLELSLPNGVVASSVQVVLDHQVIEAELTSAGSLGIDLSTPLDGSAQRMRLLEIEYHFANRPLRSGQLVLEAPQWPEESQVRRLYWQLVLPSQQHVVAGPDNLLDEQRWQWNGGLLSREPARDQQHLEDWFEIDHQPPLPANVNCYLFSALSQPSTMHVRVASRSVILFTFSFVALAIGLVLIYVPLLRRTGGLLGLALMFAVAGIVYPDQAVIAFQASLVGIALALLAAYLERTAAKRRPRNAAARRGSSSSVRPSVVGEMERRPPPHGSTMTAEHEAISVGTGSAP